MATVNVDINKVWENYDKYKKESDKNELILFYLPLVKNIVYRMCPEYSKYVDTDDLLSCGVLGLINAISRFDLKKGVSFETYGYCRIKGEVIDYLRRQDFISSSLRQKIKTVENAYSAYITEHGIPATDEEICKVLHMSLKDLHKILEDTYIYNVIYLEEFLENSNEEPETKNSFDIPEKKYEKQELTEVLADCIDCLPEKERLVITLYYYEELTLKEIGKVLNVSESRVSQIHSKAILSLRSKLKW